MPAPTCGISHSEAEVCAGTFWNTAALFPPRVFLASFHRRLRGSVGPCVDGSLLWKNPKGPHEGCLGPVLSGLFFSPERRTVRLDSEFSPTCRTFNADSRLSPECPHRGFLSLKRPGA